VRLVALEFLFGHGSSLEKAQRAWKRGAEIPDKPTLNSTPVARSTGAHDRD
jgi:hypothetical protein